MDNIEYDIDLGGDIVDGYYGQESKRIIDNHGFLKVVMESNER